MKNTIKTNETEMSHLLLDRFYGIYFDSYKRLDGEVLFKIFPSNEWMNSVEFEKALYNLVKEKFSVDYWANKSPYSIDGLVISSAPNTDEIDALIAYYIY